MPKRSEKEASRTAIQLRPYQQQTRDQFLSGKRRIINIWHRRAGKDIDSLDLAASEAEKNVGTYWHLYPTHTQARKAIWNGIDARAGVRFIDRAFPPEGRKSTLKQDMTIELNNGSIWQLCGSDRYDSLVGSNPRGVVFSEWALCDPRAWDYVRPILRENGGWVRFITTYRQRNHAYRMVQRLRNHPDWFVDVRTVDDTCDNDGNRILTEADIQAERDEGMDEALIQQEYYCNPAAARKGAVYGKELERILADRTGAYDYDRSKPVLASWSLKDDQHTVAYWQRDGNRAMCIGTRSYQFMSLAEALQDSRDRFPWKYVNRHIVPQKVEREYLDVFDNHGCTVETAGEVENIYQVTRDMLATAYVDNAPRAWEGEWANNENLLDALGGYRFAETASGQSYSNRPVATWEQHYARAVETYATWNSFEVGDGDGWLPAPSNEIYDRAVI